ncbi:MAG: hypothetical protein SF123_11570 [Chloroflexota bacterium]|nr:hypothetical protein [Chloroflexota bacterium]
MNSRNLACLYTLCLMLLVVFVQPVVAQSQTSPYEVISAENASGLQQVDVLGYGWLHKTVWMPDSSRLLVVGSNALVVYDVNDWNRPTVIPADYPPLVNVAVKADGTLIALVEEGKVRALDGQTLQELYELDASTFRTSTHESQVHFTNSYLLAQIVDNQYDFALRVWENETGQLIDTIPFSFPPDVSPSQFPYFEIEDADIERIIEERVHSLGSLTTIVLDGVERRPAQVVIRPDGRYILYRLCPNDQPETWNCLTSTSLLRDVETGEIVRQFDLNTDAIGFVGTDINRIGAMMCAQFSTDLSQRCLRWQLGIVDTNTGNFIHTASEYFINLPDIIEYSPDERYIVVVDSAQAQVFDAQSYTLIKTLGGHHGPPLDVEFSSDGQWLAASSNGVIMGGSAINLWQSQNDTWHYLQSIPCGGRIALHPIEDILICAGASSADQDKYAALERWAYGDNVSLLQAYDIELIYHVTISSDGQWLIVGLPQRLEIRDFATNEVRINIESRPLYSLADFSADMRYLFLYFGAFMPYRYLWQDVRNLNVVASDAELALINEENYPDRRWYNAVFSSDGRWLATEDDEGVISLFDADTATLIRELVIDGDAIVLQFSPDNQLLGVSVCKESAVESDGQCALNIVVVESGLVIFKSQVFMEAIFDIAFDPTGRIVATAQGSLRHLGDPSMSNENSVRLWAVPAASADGS